jgi:hypothetical protein
MVNYYPTGLERLPNRVINRNKRVIARFFGAISHVNKVEIPNERVIFQTKRIYLSIISAKYYLDGIIDDPIHWINDPIFYFDNPISVNIDPIYMNDEPVCAIDDPTCADDDLIRLDDDLIYVCDNPICIVNDLIFKFIDLIPGNTRGQSLNRQFPL